MTVADLRWLLRVSTRLGVPTAASLAALTTSFVAVGVCAALVAALSLRPISAASAGRVLAAYPAQGAALLGIPLETLKQIADRQDSLQHICGYSRGIVTVAIGDAISRRPMESVVGDCSYLFGRAAAGGRLLRPDESPLAGSAADVVLISDTLYRILGNHPSVVGSTIRVEGVPLTVVGILPRTFTGIYADTPPDLVIPTEVVSRVVGTGRPRALYAIGVARAELSDDQIASQLRSLWSTLVPDFQAQAGRALIVEPFGQGLSDLRRQYAGALRMLAGVGGLLLVVAAFNTGGLLFAKVAARLGEMGTLMALGASSNRVSMLVLMEGLLYSGVACTVSLPFTFWLASRLSQSLWTGSVPLTLDVRPDRWVILTLVATALFCGLAVSLPALVFVRRRLSAAATPHHSRNIAVGTAFWRMPTVVIQVASATVLLAVSGTLIHNLTRLASLPVGYDPSGLHFARLFAIPGAARGYDRAGYVSETLAEVERVTGGRASFSVSFPTSEMRVLTALAPVSANAAGPVEIGATIDRVAPNFFETVGARVIEGRPFNWFDTDRAQAVVVVNETFADKAFPTQSAVGATIRLPGANGLTCQVVGVTRDVSPGDPRLFGLPVVYRPVLQEPQFLQGPVLLLKTNSREIDAAAVSSVLRLRGRHYLVKLAAVEDHLSSYRLQNTLLATAATVIAALGLAQTMIGLYALTAFIVQTRRKEIAIRLAVGGSPKLVRMAVLRDTALSVTGGLLLALPLSWAFWRVSRSFIQDIGDLALTTMLGAIGVVVLAATVTIVRPAGRATRVDLAEALREL